MEPDDERRSVGRPSKYHPDYPDQARRLALLGLTDEEMAEFFGVDKRTIYNWDQEHPEFFHSRARGKIHADGRVAEKLYHRALGYRHPEVHVSSYKGVVELTELTKHYPPETEAAKLWLSNRQGGKWKVRSASSDSAEQDGKDIVIHGGLPDAD